MTETTRFIPSECDDSDCSDSGLRLLAPFDALVRAFGMPNGVSDGDKVTAIWTFTDTESPYTFTIYDWKGDEWHIGTDSPIRAIAGDFLKQVKREVGNAK